MDGDFELRNNTVESQKGKKMGITFLAYFIGFDRIGYFIIDSSVNQSEYFYVTNKKCQSLFQARW